MPIKLFKSKRAGGATRSQRGRRSVGRLGRRRRIDEWVRLIHSPAFVWGTVIAAAFVLVAGSISVWTREQPLVAVGSIVSDTRVSRAAFQIEDREATERRRQEARQHTPRVFVADLAQLDEWRASIENLPKTLSTVETLDGVDRTIREQFPLTEETFSLVKAEYVDGKPRQEWLDRVRALDALLRTKPLLDLPTFQRETQLPHSHISIRVGESSNIADKSIASTMGDQDRLSDELHAMMRRAGFPAGPVRDMLIARITKGIKPTFRLDEAATTAAQNEAAARVSPVVKEVAVGQVLYKRGDVLTTAQLADVRAETDHFLAGPDNQGRIWLSRLSLFAAVGAITLAVAGYTAYFAPRIRRNPARMAGLAGLMVGSLALAAFGTAAEPRLLMFTAVAPTVFVAVVLAIAYDQRVALAIGVLQAILAGIAMDAPIGQTAVIVTGISVAVWRLREIRHRNSLIALAAVSALALGVATVLVGLIDRPLVPGSLRQIGTDGLLAAFGGLSLGAVTLFILPLIERAFDITTGMTLIELRDPKQPLLRELQQRAPGTYNHSLNVASIAEAAADAVGADPLLTYVGSLYHDIGKMSKPEYFVENQFGGPSKHERLSPAMSLLVIVGHVKDGVEMARASGLPRAVQHFIEAHHGTTLVEFFYHRARQQAEGEGEELPEEIEYRYPGPKPRTREVAIVMLADAVESSTRTLAEPTPGRIEGLVREIANKRLLDGQFDDCELTLKDLHTISESIAKSVASIYHARIKYPTAAGPDKREPIARSG